MFRVFETLPSALELYHFSLFKFQDILLCKNESLFIVGERNDVPVFISVIFRIHLHSQKAVLFHQKRSPIDRILALMAFCADGPLNTIKTNKSLSNVLFCCVLKREIM
jgi:hypothetical protein